MPYGEDEKSPYRVLNDDYESPVFEIEKNDGRHEYVGQIARNDPKYNGLVDHGKISYWLMLPASVVVAAVIILAGMSVGLINLSGVNDDDNGDSAFISLGVPELIFPLNDEELTSSIPELIWAPVLHADSYKVEMWRGDSQIVNLASSVYRHQISVPLDDATYSWRVQAANGTTCSNWSAVSTFTVRTSLDAPELLAPGNGAMIFNSTTAFGWSDDGISGTWRIQVANDPAFAPVLLDVMVSTAALIIALDLEENATYYWRVMAGWQDIWGEWSDISSFTRAPSTAIIGHQWIFDNEEWNLNITIPMDEYMEAQAFTRWTFSPQSYSIFVTPLQSSVVQIAEYIMSVSASRNYMPTMQIWFAMEFVKAFPYALDDVTHGTADYANFPVETLFEGRGDCEDHAALFVSIVRAMGFDAIQIYMTNGTAGHMSAGVAGIDVPPMLSSYVLYQGEQYWYCETTGRYYLPGLSPVSDLSEWYIVPVP